MKVWRRKLKITSKISVRIDKFVPEGERGYIVNNLYFDTTDLRFYNDTKFRKPTRFKPRARYYGNKATNFIWPEIKYRNASVIWKRRYKIPIERWPELFLTEDKGPCAFSYK